MEATPAQFVALRRAIHAEQERLDTLVAAFAAMTVRGSGGSGGGRGAAPAPEPVARRDEAEPSRRRLLLRGLTEAAAGTAGVMALSTDPAAAGVVHGAR